MTNKSTAKSIDSGRDYPYLDSIAAIVVNIVLLYVFNNLLNWHVPHLADSFGAVVWLFNLQILTTIFLHGLLVILGSKRLRGLFESITSAISVVVLLSLYYVFPFDFSGQATMIAKAVIVFCIFATAIAAIIQFLTFLFKSSNELKNCPK